MAGNIYFEKIINSHSLHLFWQFADWLYPPECCSCQKLGNRICPECWDSIIVNQGHTCEICGDILPKHNKHLCARCSKQKPAYTKLRSFALYKGVIIDAIQSIKYRRNFGLVEYFVDPLQKIIVENRWESTMVSPVPLNETRKSERGYNQVSLIAFWLAQKMHLQFEPYALTRVKHTNSQVGLNRKQREVNVKDAFKAKPALIQGKSIIMIDDVATTGATLNSCAHALLDKGAKEVFGLTIARAIRLEDKIQNT